MSIKQTTAAGTLLSFILGVALLEGRFDRQGDEPSARVFNQLVQNWRWLRYWFGSSGIDDVAIPGKKITALVFWTKTDRLPKSGLCSPDLSLCIAYSGPRLNPRSDRIAIDGNASLRDSFEQFVKGGLRGTERNFAPKEAFQPSDFDSVEGSFTLPSLTVPPDSVLNRKTPAEAPAEATRVSRLFSCSRFGEPRPQGCKGTLVFAYYGADDPYWFVLRSCSAECESAFRGDAVEELTRGDGGWDVTSGGFVNTPGKEVERLGAQIRKAEMLRLEP
jgi:hypothetical protein